MLLSDNHLTPVVGIDIHFTTLPPFIPVHPYIGIILDPFDYIPFIGGTVHINGIKRGVSDTSGFPLPLVHIPMPTPPWLMTAIIGHESMNFFASLTVKADGTRLSPKGHMLMTCNDVGIPLSLSPGKKKFWKLVPTLFAPTSFSLPIPTGLPVNVGGPYPPDWGGVVMGLAMSFGFGAFMRFARKGLNKVFRKIKKSNKLSDLLCKAGFEPINLVTGAVFYEGTDFEFPGLIPLEWNRVWDSDSPYNGWLGHGVASTYDRCVELVPEEDGIALRLHDGRVAAFPWLEHNQQAYNRQEQITLYRLDDGSFKAYEHKTNRNLLFTYLESYTKYRLERIENPSGYGIQLHIDRGQLQKIEDSAGRVFQVDNDLNGHIISIALQTDQGLKTIVRYQYDEHENMTHIYDALNQATEMEYNHHLMVKKTDRNGQSFYWEYDGEVTGARCIHTYGDGGYQEGWIEYHNEEGYNLVTDANGATTTYWYTPEGLVTEIIDPLGNSRQMQYTDFMELYREIDEVGNITGYTYNEDGLLTSKMFADGSEQVFLYDENGQLSLAIDPEGNKTVYSYVDNHPHLIHNVVEADNSITTFSYDDYERIRTIQNNDNTSSIEYDEAHNVVKFTDTQGHSTQWKYNIWGKVQQVHRNQSAQRFSYDELGRVTQVIGADKNHTQFAYNAYDEVVEAKDKHHHVRFQYTPLGSIALREENGVKIRFEYDKMEQLQALTNEHNEYYRFVRNKRGDIIQETGFDHLERRYLRDQRGFVQRTLRPNGRYTEYEYDALGKITRAEYHDGTWESFTYDKLGRLVEARNQDNCITLLRDEMGRIVQEQQSSGLPEEEGYTIQSEYNKNGQRISLTSSLGANIQHQYNELGQRILTRAQAQDEEGNSEHTWQAAIQYNELGLEIERSLTGGIVSTFTYDQAGRPVQHQVKRGVHDAYLRSYQWDANHRLTETIDALKQGKIKYAYDAFGNLASAKYQDGSYDYKLPDKLGNLFETQDRSDKIYGPGGKLLQDKQWQYHYDAEGNLIRKTKYQEEAIEQRQDQDLLKPLPQKPNFWQRLFGTGNRFEPEEQGTKPPETMRWQSGDWAYSWQANGMLQSVQTPNGEVIEFEYDALGRRTAKLNMTQQQIFRYIWDGNVLLHEWNYDLGERPNRISDELGRLFLDREENTTNLTTWVFDEGSFVPSAKLVGDEVYSIVSDYLGTPIQAYDRTGNQVWERELDIYGKLRKGDKDFCPFLYQGQYYDEEVKLAYNRFRYYSPDTGMYISQDPIGLNGNNANFYAYTKDSNIWIDLFGLTGTYIFTDGTNSYIGKGPERRMETSIKQRLNGNKATAKTHVDFGNNDLGLMVEHKLMDDYDAVDNDAFANRINSPGKKKYEALDPNSKLKEQVDAEAAKIKSDFEAQKTKVKAGCH